MYNSKYYIYWFHILILTYHFTHCIIWVHILLCSSEQIDNINQSFEFIYFYGLVNKLTTSKCSVASASPKLQSSLKNIYVSNLTSFQRMKKVQYTMYSQGSYCINRYRYKHFNLELCYIVESTTTVYPAVYVTVRVQEDIGSLCRNPLPIDTKMRHWLEKLT